MAQVFLVQFLILWSCFFFSSKTSKSQAKRQKVAKKARGEEDADPYDFESDEEQQDTGGKHENNVNDDFVCLFLICFVIFIFLFSVFHFCFSLFFFFSRVNLSIRLEKSNLIPNLVLASLISPRSPQGAVR